MHFQSKRILVVLLVLALVSSAAWAQSGTSTIRGTVSDPKGSVVPGATVTITNTATGLTRNQKSTEVGTFSFELLPPGDYKVQIEAANFKKNVGMIHAAVGTPADASAALQVGSASEIVEVSATSSNVEVNTQDASLGNNFTSLQITQLPLEARNVQSLLTLQPAVTSAGYVAGARSDQSNITLDGVDINEAQTNAIGTPVLRLNSEAVQEFTVTTVNANANQGRSSAAQINLITKGGSNAWHGAAFEFYRGTGFTANDFFNNRVGLQRPKLLRHTYGGALGGPVKKDKLFFFYSYEGRRDTSQSAVERSVPLASLGAGNLKYKDTTGAVQTLTTAQLNQAFNVVGINPAAVAALSAASTTYASNDLPFGDGINTGGFRFNAPTPVKLGSHVAKLDWNINNRQTGFIRANVINDKITGAPQFPDTQAPQTWSHPWGGVAGHTWSINNNIVNNFRYGYTREAFSNIGDSQANAISFRFVFSPLAFSRTLSRATPVHNITDDISWIKGKHTIQFGTAMWFTNNGRTAYANAFDNAITNPSFYSGAGAVVSNAIKAYLTANALPAMSSGSTSAAQNAATALIGRFSQYSANFTFGSDGSLLASGTPTVRNFATQQYDFYVQDAWKMRHNMTLSLGLRYGIGSPVHETAGFEVKPDISLTDYYNSRVAAAAQGIDYIVPLTLNLSGAANGKSPMYPWDKNNFQPRVSMAWSPNFQGGIGHWLFGSEGKSSLRSGFAMTNDYFGQSLAVLFDLNNTLGFSSGTTIPANTYNVTTKPAPLFTAYGQQVRPLPGITVPGNVTFPRQQSSNGARRIESSLDEGLVSPTNYQWNATFERELPGKLMVQASYLGRLGRNLLATRDVMALNNLKDPKSGVDWYTAATQLEKLRQTGAASNASVANIPYFDNIFPANLAGIMNSFYGAGSIPAGLSNTQTVYYIMKNFYGNDWTTFQDDVEQATGNHYFYQPQYGALSAWGTVANSDYHGLAISVRQRMKDLSWDFNYTWSHSIDDTSGLQNSTAFGGGFILNPLQQQQSRSNSDFDVRHQINFNSVYQFPIGRGKAFAGNVNRGWDALIGGWQLASIFRWNTGLPFSSPYDDSRWATNWNVQSNGTATAPVDTCVTKGTATVAPKLFGCNTNAVYQSFRNAYPGEAGQRNNFRLPGYIVADMGLSKSFTMPYNEHHKLQLRWEVFNVTNTQHFGTVDTSKTGYGISLDDALLGTNAPSTWSNFTAIQGTPRVMQIGARFEF
ncbi:MAG: Cna protein B-type domain protein [Acidobacteriales bacterium]|nr:Cna protein B-type domain protein [Terriglobales bacterium]